MVNSLFIRIFPRLSVLLLSQFEVYGGRDVSGMELTLFRGRVDSGSK